MIEVLLADDHTIILDGLSMILAQEEDIKIVGRAHNGEEVLGLIERTHVDVVILDINMPIMDGLETAKMLKEKFPQIKILILSMYDDISYIRESIKAGVNGYVLKNRGHQELTIAIRSISEGFSYFGQEIAHALVEQKKSNEQEVGNGGLRLTKREIEVLKRFAKGYTTKQISEELFISNSTVETHKRNLVSKLGVSNSKGLVRYAISHGYVD